MSRAEEFSRLRKKAKADAENAGWAVQQRGPEGYQHILEWFSIERFKDASYTQVIARLTDDGDLRFDTPALEYKLTPAEGRELAIWLNYVFGQDTP